MPNPVIATAPCIQNCGSTVSVHQVAKGRGKRLMFYTNCPECKCDQRTGKIIQDYYFNNSSPRPGYESVFEGQIPPGIKLQNDQNTEFSDSNNNNDLTGQDDQERGSKGGWVVLALIVTGVLTAVGLKK